MPHDFWLWKEVREQTGEPRVNESAASYKSRLQKTALSLPKTVVRKAVLKMKSKAAEVVEAKGGPIASD